MLLGQKDPRLSPLEGIIMSKNVAQDSANQDERVPLSDGPLQISDRPIEAFLEWTAAAAKARVVEPTAMTLATCTPDGKPSARIVLFKGTSPAANRQTGIEFYTNYDSQKSLELKANPFAALVFHWPTLRRQIRD